MQLSAGLLLMHLGGRGWVGVRGSQLGEQRLGIGLDHLSVLGA